MVGIISSAVFALMTLLISYMAIKHGFCSNGKRQASLKVFMELDWILENTPAQASFFMFLMQAYIFICAAAFATKVSNHIILTLDIVYLISILLLILYHNIKIAVSLSLQKA